MARAANSNFGGSKRTWGTTPGIGDPRTGLIGVTGVTSVSRPSLIGPKPSNRPARPTRKTKRK